MRSMIKMMPMMTMIFMNFAYLFLFNYAPFIACTIRLDDDDDDDAVRHPVPMRTWHTRICAKYGTNFAVHMYMSIFVIGDHVFQVNETSGIYTTQHSNQCLCKFFSLSLSLPLYSFHLTLQNFQTICFCQLVIFSRKYFSKKKKTKKTRMALVRVYKNGNVELC